MSFPLSTHIPGVSGATVPVIGEAIVDTGLREVQSFVASFKVSNFVPNEEGKVAWYFMPKDAKTTQRVVIRVEKSGTNDGILDTNEVNIAWMAFGV